MVADKKRQLMLKLIYAGLIALWMLCLMVSDGTAEVVVSETEIHGVVTEYVRGLLDDFEGELKITVRRRGNLSVKGSGSVVLQIRPSQGRSSDRSFPLVLEILRGPVIVGEHLVTANVRYFDEVVVAARLIERGEPITSDVIVLENREVTAVLGRYTRDPSRVIGSQAKSRIGSGRPIDGRFLEPIPLVERKDLVRIEIRIGAITASTEGVATESGAVGDRIVVQNLASREKLLAEVIAPGVVRVAY